MNARGTARRRTTGAIAGDYQVRHPIFARLYSVLARHETDEVLEHRRRLLAGLTGRVIEVGAGTGANFPFYPPTVDEVVAVEPERYLREQAATAAAGAPVQVTVVDGTADRLPALDGSCDAAVTCLVLCSVPDQASALAELRRVVRPGGELRFYEHALAQTPGMARSQRFVDRTFWPHAFGGCHTARDTPAAIAASGFIIEDQERMSVGPPIPAATMVLGAARRS